MLIEEAQVVALEGSHALVQKARQSACNQCAVNKGCGSAVLSRLAGARFTRIRVLNEVDADIGDTVRIGIHESGLLRSALLMYALPLLCMPLAIGVLSLLASASLTDGMAILAALTGFAGGAAAARLLSGRLIANPAFAPVILSVERRAPAKSPAVLVS